MKKVYNRSLNVRRPQNGLGLLHLLLEAECREAKQFGLNVDEDSGDVTVDVYDGNMKGSTLKLVHNNESGTITLEFHNSTASAESSNHADRAFFWIKVVHTKTPTWDILRGQLLKEELHIKPSDLFRISDPKYNLLGTITCMLLLSQTLPGHHVWQTELENTRKFYTQRLLKKPRVRKNETRTVSA